MIPLAVMFAVVGLALVSVRHAHDEESGDGQSVERTSLRLGISELLGLAFSLYRRCLPALAPLTMILFVPVLVSWDLIFTALLPERTAILDLNISLPSELGVPLLVAGISAGLVLLFLYFLAIAAAIRVVAEVFFGRTADMNEMLGFARANAGRVARFGVIYVVGAAAFLAALVGAGEGPAPLVLMGLVSLVAAYFAIRLVFTLPAYVLEGRGLLASLGRSFELTRGRWWHSFIPIALVLVALPAAAFEAVDLAFADIAASQALGYLAATLIWITMLIPLEAAVITALFLNGHTDARRARLAGVLYSRRALVEVDLEGLGERLLQERPRAPSDGVGSRWTNLVRRGHGLILGMLLPAALYLTLVIVNPHGFPEGSLATEKDPVGFGVPIVEEGRPFLVSEGDEFPGFFGFERCDGATCSQGESFGNGFETTMGKAEVGTDGTLWGAYWVEPELGEEEPRELQLMSCGPEACDNSQTTLDRQPPPVPFSPSPLGLTTTKQGLPVVVYREHVLTGPRLIRKRLSDEQDSYNGFFKVLQCLDMSCSQRRVERFKAEGPAAAPLGSVHAIDASIDEEGRLVVAYHGLGGSSLEVATCELGSCRSTAVRKRVIYTGLFGVLPERSTMADVEFGADGLPIIGFLLLSEDETITLRVVKCVSPDCATLETSDVEHLGSAYFDWRFDLEIGPEGDPLIALFDWDELAIEVIRCTNADCGATKRSVIANLDDRFAADLTLEVGAEETSVYYIESSLTEDPLARRVEPLDRESVNHLICHDPYCGAS